MVNQLRVAVCGELPTACDHLLRQGVIHIDQYMDATELREEAYHLILIYAPQAEGILNTTYTHNRGFMERKNTIPIRLLNEPCCHSALLELSSVIRRISRSLKNQEVRNE